MTALRELKTWTPETVARLQRAAEFPGAVAGFQVMAERGLVSAVANESALALYEVRREETGDKAATIHAMEGRQAHRLLSDMVRAGSALGVTGWRWRTRTKSRARLYGRWLRELARAGLVESYMISQDAADVWRGHFITRAG